MTLELAIQQIEFARSYTLSLLADIAPEEWFTMPPGCSTHVAWQVGHMAMAEYGLCLGTTPQSDPAKNPSPEEIREVFDKVHAQVLLELPTFTAEQLAEPVDMPYAAYPTKLGSLLFCSHHEMIHAGQLGLLRRMLGKQPVR